MYVWIVTVDEKFSEVFADHPNVVQRIKESVELSWSRAEGERPVLTHEVDGRLEWTMGVEAFRQFASDRVTHL